MPRMSSLLLSTNTKSGNPAYLGSRQSFIDDASSITSLVTALEFEDDEDVMAAAGRRQTSSPGAVVQAIVAAYRVAVAAGTDGVHTNWHRSGGYSVTIAHVLGHGRGHGSRRRVTDGEVAQLQLLTDTPAPGRVAKPRLSCLSARRRTRCPRDRRGWSNVCPPSSRSAMRPNGTAGCLGARRR